MPQKGHRRDFNRTPQPPALAPQVLATSPLSRQNTQRGALTPSDECGSLRERVTCLRLSPSSRTTYGMNEGNSMARLAGWFLSQCDGDWEHSHSVELGTLDNPGWAISIDIQGTELERRPVERKTVRRSQADWVEVWPDDHAWRADCGLLNLDEMVGYFLDWAVGARA
jgi:hypothetical protein